MRLRRSWAIAVLIAEAVNSALAPLKLKLNPNAGQSALALGLF